MRRTSRATALLLAAAVPFAGCATTHLGGEYRTKSTKLVSKSDQRVLTKGSEWQFLWGLLDTGHTDVDDDLNKMLRENEVVTDIEIKDRLSVGGFFLWIITAGIVSHHAIVVKGRPAVVRTETTPPPSSGTSAAPQKETIIVPAQPAPAGYERDRDTDRSGEYRDGTKTDERR